MAERRMFAKTIIDSDAFLDMPLSAQALYFHLSMRADDDGFVNNPKKIQRMIGASDDDYKILIAKSFVLLFESGVIVIKHWRINNYIRGDRYKETVYTEEMGLLSVKENGSYTLGIPHDNHLVYQMDTQVRLDKDSKGKDSLGKDSLYNNTPYNPPRYYPNDESLDKTFADYVAMRKKIKKPMTDRAVDLAIKKLNELSKGDNDLAIRILEQSIMNSWQGLFPIGGASKTSQTIDWSQV